MLVQGVAGDQGGLGYFGFSYYEQNQDKLNLVKVDDGERLRRADHARRSRTALQAAVAAAVHVPERRRRSKRPEVKAFMDYVVDNYQAIADGAQIVPMTAGAGGQGARPSSKAVGGSQRHG